MRTRIGSAKKRKINCVTTCDKNLVRRRRTKYLAKHFPNFVEEAALVLIRLGLEIGRIVELVEHGLFFRGHVLGCPDVDVDELFASFVGIYARKAFAFEAEDLTALGSRGDLDLGLAVDGRHFGLEAKDSIGKGEMELVGDV